MRGEGDMATMKRMAFHQAGITICQYVQRREEINPYCRIIIVHLSVEEPVKCGMTDWTPASSSRLVGRNQ